MKKSLLLLSLFATIGLPVFAQSESNGLGPYIGASAGLNNTWIIIDNELKNNEHHKHNFTFGPTGGIEIGYKFNPKHSAQLEGYYSNQGGNYDLKDDAGNVVGKKEIELNYFAVPLLFKFTGAGETRFNVHIGPEVEFMINGKETNTFDKDVTYTKTWSGHTKTIPKGTYVLASTDDSDKKEGIDMGDFNRTAVSILFGFGVEHDLSDQLYISGNLRFNYSFTEIRDAETVTDAYNPDKYTLRYNVFGGLNVGIHYFFQKQ